MPTTVASATDPLLSRIAVITPRCVLSYPVFCGSVGESIMPMTYHIDTDARILYVTALGVTTQAERMETMLAWINDPAFTPGLDTFCDFSTAESTPRLTNLRELVAAIGENAPKIGHKKVAILAAKPITFGVARVFKSMAEFEEIPLTVKVFFERDKLWEWLRPGQPVPE